MFREDISGNDTMRSKASQGSLPGAARTSTKTSETVAGKAGANSSAIKASADKLGAEAETGFDNLASGLGGNSSKGSKGQAGSTGGKSISALSSDADELDEYEEDSDFAGSLSGGSSKVSPDIC